MFNIQEELHIFQCKLCMQISSYAHILHSCLVLPIPLSMATYVMSCTKITHNKILYKTEYANSILIHSIHTAVLSNISNNHQTTILIQIKHSLPNPQHILLEPDPNSRLPSDIYERKINNTTFWNSHHASSKVKLPCRENIIQPHKKHN